MSWSTTPRELARTFFQLSARSSAQRTRRAVLHFTQPFSSSAPQRDDEDVLGRKNILTGFTMTRPASAPKPQRPATPAPKSPSGLSDMVKFMEQPKSGPDTAQMTIDRATKERHISTNTLYEAYEPTKSPRDELLKALEPDPEPYHFHIYSHKHNTHVTVTRPNRDPILSLSCGNLGFRKSNRKSYDSAYQLGAYVIDKLQQQGWHNKIGAMEVCLRGYGPGREAVTKVLMGTEGTLLRAKVTRVSDATRLKFGGTRSKAPRRL